MQAESFCCKRYSKKISVKFGTYYLKHSSCAHAPISIIRPRRQIQSLCSSVQHLLYLLCFRRWISSRPSPKALKWNNHLAWSHLFRQRHVCDRYIFSGTRSFVVEVSRYSARYNGGRKGSRVWVTDSLTWNKSVEIGYWNEIFTLKWVGSIHG